MTPGTDKAATSKDAGVATGDRAAAIRIQGLAKRYPGQGDAPLAVLDGIDLDVRPGEFLSIIGPSGCGKSTLLSILSGLEAPSEGEVDCGSDRLAQVFQRPLLLPWRDVLDNVTFSLECRGEKARDLRADATALLTTMGLQDFLHFKPHELSVGMRQRVDLARALLLRPRVLLMDEPFASLDARTHAAMQAELLLSWQEQGFTVVFVSHDLEELVFLSDRIVFLSEKPTRVARIVEVDLPRPRAADAEGRVAVLRLAEELAEQG